MPYDHTKFAILQYAGKFNIYFYGIDEDITRVGYFDKIFSRVENGDLILHQLNCDGETYLTYYKISKIQDGTRRKVVLVYWLGDKPPAPKPKEEQTEADTPAPTKGFTAKPPEENPAPAEQGEPQKKKGK